MSYPRKPFRINVGFIIAEEVGYSHHIPFDLEKVKLEDLELQNLVADVTVDRTPQGLLVQGKFSADTDLECARCLNEFTQHLTWDFTELYAFNKKSISESELLVPEDAQLDLAPLIREYALLEVPINPLHDPQCKGLCVECGQDLNLKDCGHSQDSDESPFSALKNLL